MTTTLRLAARGVGRDDLEPFALGLSTVLVMVGLAVYTQHTSARAAAAH